MAECDGLVEANTIAGLQAVPKHARKQIVTRAAGCTRALNVVFCGEEASDAGGEANGTIYRRLSPATARRQKWRMIGTEDPADLVSEGGGLRMPVVGIGASAGGIEAFHAFFANMPPDTGMGFVVVLHLPADRKSILPEILRRWTEMPIEEVTEGCVVQPNHVYVPPSGVSILIGNGRLHLHTRLAEAPRDFSPISTFFDSLATRLGVDAVGVVLSGTGSDGALGLKAIKARGGLTLAQGSDGTSPQHSGMPASAIATGAVDIVASVEAMPGHIIAVQQARRQPDAPADLPADQTNAARLAICATIQRQLGHDFSRYKDKTFLRRVQRRMQVLRIETLADYLAHLEGHRTEVVMLFSDLLIGVTSFFRDPETFDLLKRSVIPKLFAGKTQESSVRVWVAGCATGEEAYSLAILLREQVEKIGSGAPRIQVFATDIDEPAIAAARAGRYPPTLVQGLAPERLARFFTIGMDGSYQVSKEIRELCTFSAHSLTRDPPFSRIDMVSCRNLLIYLDSDLQMNVIPAFHYALVPDGILLLGSSETIARHDDLFTTVDRGHRIFRRIDAPSPTLRLNGRAHMGEALPVKAAAALRLGTARNAASRLSSRAASRVLERFAPAFVVATEDGEVVQYSNRTGRFLEAAAGLPSQNVLDMARRGLRAPLRNVLKQCAETGRPVEKRRISVDIAGEGVQRITLAVEPIIEQGAHTVYLIVFIEAGPTEAPAKSERRANPAVDATPDRHLEAELRDTREQLQAITEEHDTAVEELRSANEELHSVNEELQSANEELETSKEEIQSINEELQTVNAQLASKVDELDNQNTDLQNLFASVQVATIFLDQHLVIRGFTPAVAGIYNLIPSDHGRPLTDIMSQLRYTDLRKDVRYVLDGLQPLERRVEREDGGSHYLMRILPYRAPDSTVDGAVVTFVEVTTIVQAEQHQRLLVDELNHRVKNMLTVVISLATQTMRRSSTMEAFSRNYLGRIHALTAAYSLLSKEAWQTVSLRDIVMEEVKPFLAGDRTNILAHGPPIPLEPRAALALGMAIHELTTNAVKYGALSVPEGTVRVSWRLEEGADGSYLELDWTESDGPAVTPPERHGFGMMLIERGLKQDMSAEVDVEFAPNGVRARFRAPLTIGASPLPADAISP